MEAITIKKLFFILNPHAGQKKANKQLVELLALFTGAGYAVSIHITEGPGDGMRVVAERGQQYDLIVCCGGDGTFNEVISGILKSGAKIPIGYIPAGSTNDFASSLGLSTDLLEAAQDILAGTPEAFDIGLFGQRPFSYVASFGAFTRTSYNTPQSMKNAFGHAAYILSGIQEISQLKPIPISLSLPDGICIEGEYLFGAISNSTCVGGVLTLDPGIVDMQDGKFELLLIRAPKDFRELSECILALQKQTYDSPMITFMRTTSLTITAPEDMPWSLDGEREEGHGQIKVENLQHAISVIRRRDT